MQFAMDMVDSDVLEPANQITDAEDRLRFILDRQVGMSDHVKSITILAEEGAALNGHDRGAIIDHKRKYFACAATLQELKDEGKLRDLDVSVATLNLFAMVLGQARWYHLHVKLSAEEVAEQSVRLLLEGLLAPGIR